MRLGWHDSEEIGLLLFEEHSGLDPLSVRFTKLHQMVINLPGFEDDPKESNEAILEAIQMAWYEEVHDSLD